MQKNGAKKPDKKKSEPKKFKCPKQSKVRYGFYRRFEQNKLKRILRASGEAEARRWANQHDAEAILLELELTTQS